MTSPVCVLDIYPKDPNELKQSDEKALKENGQRKKNN